MAGLLSSQQLLRQVLVSRITSQQPAWLRLAAAWDQTTRPQTLLCKADDGVSLHALPYTPRRGIATDASNLPDTMSLLRNLDNGAEIFLVGTAHVSSASAQEVRNVIRRVQPATVMVELDRGRAQQMMHGDQSEGFSFVKAMASKLGGGGGSWAQMFAGASLQAMYRSLRYAGLDPGAEFKAAMLEAEAINAKIVYGDQEVNTTMGRISQHLGIQNLMRMLASAATDSASMQDLMKDDGQEKMSLTDQVEAMKTRRSVRQMMDMMRKLNPGLVRALVDERDQVMVDCLSGMKGTVVGVVGLGHLDGMERLWAERKSQTTAAA